MSNSGEWFCDTTLFSPNSIVDFSHLNKVEQVERRRIPTAQFTLFESSAPALNFTSFDALPAFTK